MKSRALASIALFLRQMLLDLVFLLLGALLLRNELADDVVQVGAIAFWVPMVMFVRVINLELVLRFALFWSAVDGIRARPLAFGASNAVVLVLCEELWRYLTSGSEFIPLWESGYALFVALGVASAMLFPWIARRDSSAAP